MSTAEKIFYILKEKGIKQTTLARHMGLSRQLVFKWKIGESKSFYRYLEDIAQFLDVSADYLLGRSDDQTRVKNKINKKDVEFALKNPDKFDNQTYEDIQKYAEFIERKYKYKRLNN